MSVSRGTKRCVSMKILKCVYMHVFFFEGYRVVKLRVEIVKMCGYSAFFYVKVQPPRKLQKQIFREKYTMELKLYDYDDICGVAQEGCCDLGCDYDDFVVYQKTSSAILVSGARKKAVSH